MNAHRWNAAGPIALVAACTALSACNASNNPVVGRVEAQVAGHMVVVSECYTFRYPSVETVGGGETQRFAPCKDAIVQIKGQTLYVNGQGYGDLKQGDRIDVRKGKVTISPQE